MADIRGKGPAPQQGPSATTTDPRIDPASDDHRHRRPCRLCGRRNARPAVDIGSSRWWDCCWRCTEIITRRRVNA